MCKAVQLWRKYSLLQNIYQGLRFNKVLAMAKDQVFLDIKVCTGASLTLVPCQLGTNAASERSCMSRVLVKVHLLTVVP